MKALISPLEPREAGYRVAEVCTQSFEIAAPMFWVDCSEDLLADQLWYDPQDQTFKAFPVQETQQTQPISEGAQDL